MEKLWVSQAFWGLYPNVFTAVKLNIKDYEQTKLTVSFYDVDVSRGETGDPVETIVLTIKSVEEPKKSSGSSHSLEETTGTKRIIISLRIRPRKSLKISKILNTIPMLTALSRDLTM